MLGVFVAILACGLILALLTPVRYTAHSSLLIRLGRSYVYQPQVGDAARGAAPDNDQVVQSELEILQSDAVKSRVVEDIGLARLAPGRAADTPPPEAASPSNRGRSGPSPRG